MQTDDLARLYREHYVGLVRLATLLLGDRPAAEDVVQEAFVSTSSSWFRLRDPARAARYLRRSVVNGCRTRQRRRATEDRYQHTSWEPPAPSAESQGIAQLTRTAVVEAVSALPQRQREVVYLRYYLDLPEAEIAHALGISRGAVKSHAARASAHLRPVLEGYRP